MVFCLHWGQEYDWIYSLTTDYWIFFSRKAANDLGCPSETFDFQRRMSGISEESKPHTQHIFWTGHPKQMDSWKEAPVFWTLPNNSVYSDEEVRCPPENCKLFRNADHQKGTLRKAYLESNSKFKKRIKKKIKPPKAQKTSTKIKQNKPQHYYLLK